MTQYGFEPDFPPEIAQQLAALKANPPKPRRIGDTFDAIVTGATPKGTFVRVMQPRVKGLLAEGGKGLNVGDKLTVKLIRTDVQRGFIDFGRFSLESRDFRVLFRIANESKISRCRITGAEIECVCFNLCRINLLNQEKQ
jgi:hypothetical protein